MRRILTAAILFFCILSLTGCSEYNQLENLAYGIILGVDLAEDNQIRLTLQVPGIGKSGGSEQSEPRQLVYSASGANFDEALNMLHWAVPRKLSLMQLKLVLFSEPLARSDRFAETLDSMMHTNSIYSSAYAAVCEGSVPDFIQAEKQSIGSDVFTELEAMFEDYTKNGFIPDATLADLYFRTSSIYSDPLAIYAASVPEDMLFSDNAEQASSLITPSELHSSRIRTQQPNRFLGAAVFHKGRMVGKLTGDQVIHTMLMRGDQITFPYTKDGKTVYLTRIGYPKVSIDTGVSPVRISIDLRLSALPGSSLIPLDGIEKDIASQLTDTIHACRTIGAEPFRFAENAARRFPTYSSWLAFDWGNRFKDCETEISISLRFENK